MLKYVWHITYTAELVFWCKLFPCLQLEKILFMVLEVGESPAGLQGVGGCTEWCCAGRWCGAAGEILWP